HTAPAARRGLPHLRGPPHGPRCRRRRSGRPGSRTRRRVVHLEDDAGLPGTMVGDGDGQELTGRRALAGKGGGDDEGGGRVRPGRSSRPRTRTRPKHDDAVDGFVMAVDRGRYTVEIEGAPAVTAMRARELGRKSVVVGDRVAL